MTTPTISPENEAYHERGPEARPVGISILAVLSFVGAAFAALGALFFLFLGAALGSFAGSEGALAGTLVGGLVGGFFVVFAVVEAVVGYGLWNGRNWAWILTLIVTGFYAIASLIGLSQGEYSSIVSLAIGGGILWYLFQPGVKRYFGQAA